TETVPAGSATTGEAIGALRLAGGKLAFQWSDDMLDQEKRNRLQMCVFRFTHRGKVHDVQLREPLTEITPVVLGNWMEVFEHRVDLEAIDPLPPVASLAMRMELRDGFPATTQQQGDPQALRAEDQLMLQFATASYAG